MGLCARVFCHPLRGGLGHKRARFRRSPAATLRPLSTSLRLEGAGCWPVLGRLLAAAAELFGCGGADVAPPAGRCFGPPRSDEKRPRLPVPSDIVSEGRPRTARRFHARNDGKGASSEGMVTPKLCGFAPFALCVLRGPGSSPRRIGAIPRATGRGTTAKHAKHAKRGADFRAVCVVRGSFWVSIRSLSGLAVCGRPGLSRALVRNSLMRQAVGRPLACGRGGGVGDPGRGPRYEPGLRPEAGEGDGEPPGA